MKTYTDIYNAIVPNNFGTSFYKGNVLISNGIRLALENNIFTEEQLDNCLNLFESGNYGTAYGYGETVIKGHEYGEYKTDLTPDSEKGNIWINREVFTITIYFMFER